MPLPSKRPEINLEKTEQFKEDPKLFFPARRHNGFNFLDDDIAQIDDNYINTFISCRMIERNYGNQILGDKFKIYSTQYHEKDADKLIHDRFAIPDGETFHFGGTVGGYQQGFTAFSCGWSDREILKLLNYLIKNNQIYEVKNL